MDDQPNTAATAAPAEQSDDLPCPFEPGSENYWASAKPSSQPARDAAEEIARTFQHGDVWGKTYQELRDLAHTVITKHFHAAAAPAEQSERINQLRSNGCDSTFPGCARAGIMRGAKWICANHAVSIRRFEQLRAPVAATGDDEGESK